MAQPVSHMIQERRLETLYIYLNVLTLHHIKSSFGHLAEMVIQTKYIQIDGFQS